MDLVTPEEEAYLDSLVTRSRKGEDCREELRRVSDDHSLRRQYWRRIGDFVGTRVAGPTVENNT